MRTRRPVTLAAIAVSVLAVARLVGAQDTVPATGCADVSWPALTPHDAGYAHAAALARALADRGFIITCVAPSTMTAMFDGQDGAALYGTNQGSFDALFLPNPQNFDRLEITERHESGRYVYSFAGRPRTSAANRIDGSRRVYFMKHANELIVAHDGELAASLSTTLARLQP